MVAAKKALTKESTDEGTRRKMWRASHIPYLAWAHQLLVLITSHPFIEFSPLQWHLTSRIHANSFSHNQGKSFSLYKMRVVWTLDFSRPSFLLSPRPVGVSRHLHMRLRYYLVLPTSAHRHQQSTSRVLQLSLVKYVNGFRGCSNILFL
jgi:hypothetical protein